jgi:hypothetical protein
MVASVRCIFLSSIFFSSKEPAGWAAGKDEGKKGKWANGIYGALMHAPKGSDPQMSQILADSSTRVANSGDICVICG